MIQNSAYPCFQIELPMDYERNLCIPEHYHTVPTFPFLSCSDVQNKDPKEIKVSKNNLQLKIKENGGQKVEEDSDGSEFIVQSEEGEEKIKTCTENNSNPPILISDEIYSLAPEEYKTYTGLARDEEDCKTKHRQDTINKSVVRMIRKFYHKIFMKHNKRFVKERLCNVDFTDIYEACRTLITEYLTLDPEEDLVQFLYMILRVR